MARPSSPEPIARTSLVLAARELHELQREARIRRMPLSALIRGLVRDHLATLRVLDAPTDLANKDTAR